MASLYIPSLLDRQKRKYWGRICAAREELARFEDGLDDLVGVSTAGIVRLHLHPSLALRLKLNPVPDVPPEGQEAYAEALRLVRQETQFTRHLHSPVCCYRERSSPPYVTWCYGVSWDDIECQRNEEGMVTLDYAMRLWTSSCTGSHRRSRHTTSLQRSSTAGRRPSGRTGEGWYGFCGWRQRWRRIWSGGCSENEP